MHWEGWAVVRASLRDREHNTGWIRCGFREFREKTKEDLQEKKRTRKDNCFMLDVLKRWRCSDLELQV